MEVLDSKDLKIIEILREDGRATYTRIARELGISDVAALKRIKRLERLGVIRKYTVVLDPKKLGYNAVSITGLDVEPEHLFSVIATLKEKDYVRYLALTTGDHAVIAMIWARNNEELSRIHDELSKMPGVKRVCPAVLLEVVKET